MAFCLYILRCADGSYYVGHTENLERRLAEHQAGGYSRYTRGRRPLTLQFTAEFPTRLEALERERQIKRWTRRKKEALIRNDWTALKQRNAAPPVLSAVEGFALSDVEGERSGDPNRYTEDRAATAIDPPRRLHGGAI